MSKGVKTEQPPCHDVEKQGVNLFYSEEYVHIDVVDKECSKDDYIPHQLIDVDHYQCAFLLAIVKFITINSLVFFYLTVWVLGKFTEDVMNMAVVWETSNDDRHKSSC